jgi:cysteine synthase
LTLASPSISASIEALIGNTPLIALNRLHPGPGRILAKAEYLLPGGSMKDRAALHALRDARACGQLKPGQVVVEMTSGNMGAGLAIACTLLGHPFVAVMSEGNSPARRKALELLGAQVVLVPQVNGTSGQVTGDDIAVAQLRAAAIADETGAYLVDQFRCHACVEAHYLGTGPELWNASGGRIDAFVMAVGTGASFVGIARFLKEQNPAILCVAVEPQGAEVLRGGAVTKPQHALQGIGYGTVPPMWKPDLLDLSIGVSDDDATHMRTQLARKEGLNVGYSAAANVVAAQTLLNSGRLPADATVATLLCDHGMKYD